MSIKKPSYIVFLIVILLFFVECGTASSLIDKTSTNYIILSNDRSIVSQLTMRGSTYVISDDIDLKKHSITIPEDCILLFRGGRLKNGSLNLNNCYIEGNARFDCSVTGCPSNEHIYTKWFSNSNNELFVLLRNFCSCWYNDKVQIITRKNKRVIHIEKSEYTITEGIELRNEQDLTLDFCGSTIIDNIDTYDDLRHRATSVIAIRGSSRIIIDNCNYVMGDKKGKVNHGGSFLSIGGPHVTTIAPNHDISINNITGKSNPKAGETFIPIDVLGNCYNIDIGNITWTGAVSSLVNLESSVGPMTSKEVETAFSVSNWTYPDNYGLTPYNITIHNIYGYNRPNAKYGYIRTGGAYNVSVQNVYCWDVREVIELYQGDSGLLRSAMNITVSNVSSYWSKNMEKPNYAVSINITRCNPQSQLPNLENSDIAMIRFIDCDFQDNMKGNPEDHYLVRIHGNNGMTVFSNCRMRNTQRAVRISDIINTSLLTHVTKFESCLFQDCVVGLDCQNTIVAVKDCIFDTGEKHEGQIKYSIRGLSAESLANNGAMLNAEGNMFRSKKAIKTPYVSLISATKLPKNVHLNVSRNIFSNTKSVAAIKSKNVILDAENNIGELIVDKSQK